MNESDLLLGSVELTGAFTKRKEKRVNAESYQQGWIEWKTKSTERRLVVFDIGFEMKASRANGEKPRRRGKKD